MDAPADSDPASISPPTAATGEWPVFISYRHSGLTSEIAKWLKEELEKEPVQSLNEQWFRLDVFVDSLEPSRGDFQEFLVPHLQHSRALVILADAGAAIRKPKPEKDYLYEELDWWGDKRPRNPPLILDLDQVSAKKLTAQTAFAKWEKISWLECYWEEWQKRPDLWEKEKTRLLAVLRQSIREYGHSVHLAEVRRLRRLAWGLAAAVIMALGIAWWADHQRRVAEEARANEATARAASEKLIDHMLVDLRDKLVPLGKSDLMAFATQSAEDYFRKFPKPVRNMKDGARRTRMWIERGDALQTQGFSDRALNCYHEAVLLTETPGAGGTTFDRAFALSRVATTCLSLGRLDEAASAFIEAQGGFKKSSDEEVNARQRQRYLAACEDGLAQVAERQGQVDEARRHYERSVEVFAKLAAEDGDKSPYRLEYAEALRRQADFLMKLGELPAARTALETSHQTLKAFGKENDSLKVRDCYAASCEKLGLLCLREGRLEEAEKWFHTQYNLSVMLFATDTKNVHWKRDAAVALNWQGEVQWRQEKNDAARKSFEEARVMFQELAYRGDAPPSARNDLATAFEKAGDTTADAAAAVTHYQSALELQRQLATESPNEMEYHLGSGIYLRKLAGALERAKKMPEALKCYEKACEVLSLTIAQFPSVPEPQEQLAYSLAGMAERLIEDEDRERGIATMLESKRILDGLNAIKALDAAGQEMRRRITMRVERLEPRQRVAAPKP
jgi:tetratricopeptide (TPR) repeat protein